MSRYRSDWPATSYPGERFVEDQQVGLAQKRPGEENPVELAAGDLPPSADRGCRLPRLRSAGFAAEIGPRANAGLETVAPTPAGCDRG